MWEDCSIASTCLRKANKETTSFGEILQEFCFYHEACISGSEIDCWQGSILRRIVMISRTKLQRLYYYLDCACEQFCISFSLRLRWLPYATLEALFSVE